MKTYSMETDVRAACRVNFAGIGFGVDGEAPDDAGMRQCMQNYINNILYGNSRELFVPHGLAS